MLLRCPSVGPSVAPTRNFIFKPKLPLPFSSPTGPSFCYLDIFLSTVFLLTHHRTLSLPKRPSLDTRAKDGVFGERRGNIVIQSLTAGQRKLGPTTRIQSPSSVSLHFLILAGYRTIYSSLTSPFRSRITPGPRRYQISSVFI